MRDVAPLHLLRKGQLLVTDGSLGHYRTDIYTQQEAPLPRCPFSPATNVTVRERTRQPLLKQCWSSAFNSRLEALRERDSRRLATSCTHESAPGVTARRCKLRHDLSCGRIVCLFSSDFAFAPSTQFSCVRVRHLEDGHHLDQWRPRVDRLVSGEHARARRQGGQPQEIGHGEGFCSGMCAFCDARID